MGMTRCAGKGIRGATDKKKNMVEEKKNDKVEVWGQGRVHDMSESDFE